MTRFRNGTLLAFLAAFISGCSIWLNAFAVTGINAGVFTGLKNLSVGLVLAGLILATKERRALMTLKMREVMRLMLIGLIGGSVPFILFFTGLQQTTAARGGFIQKTLFIFVAILAARFLKERVTGALWLGIGALLVGQIIFLQLVPVSFSRGDLLILIATILWACETVLSKHTLETMSPTLVAAGRMLCGGVFIWTYLYFTGAYQSVATLSPLQIQWVIATSLILLAYVLTFYHALALIPAHIATSILALGAPITAALAALFQNKTMSLAELSGLIIISLTLAFIIRVQQRAITLPHVLSRDHS